MQEWVAGAASLVEWLIAWLQVFWPAIVATAGVVAAVWVTLHVAQHKRDARAAAACPTHLLTSDWLKTQPELSYMEILSSREPRGAY